MDQNRQIRFLIPPFFLLAAIFLADFLSCANIIRYIANLSDKNILAIIAALGASTIPLCFLIGALPIALLNLYGSLRSKIKNEETWNYEAVISDETCKRIWPQLELELSYRFDLGRRFYISATFDHGILPRGINEWIMRRWNAFNLNINCVTALFLALIFCWLSPSFKITSTWMITVFLFMVTLIYNARVAWRQTMGMIDFQAARNLNKKKGNEKPISQMQLSFGRSLTI